MGSLEDDVRKLIADRKITVVIGSGVSKATCSKAPTWRGLIESGIERCHEVLGVSRLLCDQYAALLKADDLDALLGVAEFVESKLKKNGGGQFRGWLRAGFESLKIDKDKSILDALAKFDVPLVTTNYDELIEQVSPLRSVTWLDTSDVTRVMRREDRRVLHLHGHWEKPESVVLGIRSYEKVKDHEHTQTVMKSFALTTSFLFVGCGKEGLSDPNWGPFCEWLKEFDKDGGHEHHHYMLVREDDSFVPTGSLHPLVYGKDYENLGGFLQQLVPPQPEALIAGDTTSATHSASTLARALLPTSVSAYLKRLEAQNEKLALAGMGRDLPLDLPMADVYVPLRTRQVRLWEEGDNEGFKRGHLEVDDDVELSDVFKRCRDQGKRGALLLGHPGSGKTTGGRQLAWRLASGQSLPQDLGLPAGITPVLLKFRNLSKAILADELNGLQRFLVHETRDPKATTDSQEPGRELWNARGGLLWILDGLDEVMESKGRSQVSSWIQQALVDRPCDWFLVTCRFQSHDRKDKKLLADFIQFDVRSLDDEQIKDFVSAWYSAVFRNLPVQEGDSDARADSESRELLTILKKPAYQIGRMRELSTNPLLLTIMCLVFYDKKQLPNGRADLYANCIRVLLDDWRKAVYSKDLDAERKPYDAEIARSVLARVAWWMHQEQDRTAASLNEMAVEAEKVLAAANDSAGLGRDGLFFLKRMREESGILALAGEGEDRCSFLHRTFQEYLAAEHAVKTNQAKFLAVNATQAWWREAALLSLRYSEQHCDSFFTEMLKAGIAEQDPNLADQCLNEASFFSPEPFLNVLKDKQTKPARRAAVLRILSRRTDRVPGLEKIARGLMASADPQVASLAREIMATFRPELHSARGELRANTLRVDPEPGAIWIDDRTGISYVWIPAGDFLMGSDKGNRDEIPRHRVRISQPFWLARCPVTNAQYWRFLESQHAATKSGYWDDRRFNQPEQPVVGVSWDDATAFSAWAQARLPSEAEWEYACRAGSQTVYCFGDDPKLLGDYAWFAENSQGQTQPVGAKQPNAWGLHDMHGNVWEWCQDWWGKNYYKSSPEVDPPGPPPAINRVFRGGGWGGSAARCRSAIRSVNSPGYRISYLGFRLARGQ